MIEAPRNPEQGKIRSGVTLKDLIQERGYKGKGLAPFVDDLLEEWHAQILPTIEKMSVPQTEYDDSGVPKLSTRDVFLPEGSVHILGINHNAGIKSLFKNSPDSYESVIAKYVKGTAQKGRLWVSEQNLNITEGVQELNDHELYFDMAHPDNRHITEEEFRKGHIFTFRKNKEIFRKIATAFIKDKFSKKAGHAILGVKASTMAELPQPLDMEASLVLANGDDDDFNIGVDRSGIMATAVRSIIGESEGKYGHVDLGIVCGYTHETQVAYFLNHREYNPHESLSEAKRLINQDNPK